MRDLPREEKGPGPDTIESDIKKLSEKVDKVLEETDRKFARCPKCGLPTHLGQDSRKAYCASCNMYFDVDVGKKGKKKLRKRDRSIPLQAKVAVVVFGLLLIVGFGSITLLFFNFESDPGYIDIHEVNDIRKLPKAEDVPMEKLSSHELELYLRNSIDNETRRDIRRDEVVYKFLFIIPYEWDLVDIFENESSGAGIAGMYDTEEEKMYIIGESSSKNRVNSILSHEYTHALQDQNFDLDSIYPTGTHDGDLAMLCSIEGDAMKVMEEWEDRNLNDLEKFALDLETVIQAVSTLDIDGEYYSSEILAELTYFPYTEGLKFVKKVYQEGGDDAVNALFTDRPALSTEQILHFEKYMDNELPIDVSFTGNTTGLDLQFTSTIGEKILSEVISYNAWTSSGTAAEGWGGDKFYHYTSGDEFLDILVTEWDSVQENNRFAADYENVLDYQAFDFGNVFSIDGNYAFMESSGTSTVIYYSSSMDLIEMNM